MAVEKVGPQDIPHVATHDTTHDTTHVATYDTVAQKILDFCQQPHFKAEIAAHCGYKNTKNFTQKYLRPLLNSGQIQMTIPDKPRSKNQKYITVDPQ